VSISPRVSWPRLIAKRLGLWFGVGMGWRLALILLIGPVSGADWPHWRGPTYNGISSESDWTDQWPAEGPPILWRQQVGLGYSGFVVASGRVYTAGHTQEKDTLFCFDAGTGREIWKHSHAADLGDKYFEGGTTGTPTVDGERVYRLSRWGDLFCFQADNGKIVWQKNIARETGVPIPGWGFSGAPLVQGDLLILNAGEAGMALEKTGGKLVWKSESKDAGYSTPVPFQWQNQTWIGLASGQAYLAVHPRTGKEAWRIRWLTQFDVNAADPVFFREQVFISTGYGKGAALFQMSTNDLQPIWKSKVLRTQLNAAVLYEGYLYGIDGDTTDKAPLKCVEWATGKEQWSVPGNSTGTGGLMIAGKRLLLLAAHGELIVAPVSPQEFRPTGRVQVFGGKSATAPVLADGRIYCRNSRGDLACVDVRKPK
jgi:outer membrane protein assembly factor BamB